MFSSSLRASLVAVAFAAVASAASLSLTVSGPQSVDGVQNLRVSTTLTNTGAETARVLNDPRGPLSTIPANTFTVTAADGSQAAFSGVRAKFVPSHAIELGAVTVLAPGQSVTVEHNLADAYNLTSSGVGEYDIEANNLFQVVDENNNISPVYAETSAHTARVKGRLAEARVEPALSKRATFNGCSSSQQALLNTAAADAQGYAANALSYIQAQSAATPRHTTWFGTYTTARHNTLLNHFDSMSNGNTYSSYKYDCTCTDTGTYAYVYPDTYAVVYLCGAFWKAPATGTDSKAGTLVHESSHFSRLSATDDWTYGQSSCKSLAISNPDRALNNADSHEYFAENTPTLA